MFAGEGKATVQAPHLREGEFKPSGWLGVVCPSIGNTWGLLGMEGGVDLLEWWHVESRDYNMNGNLVKMERLFELNSTIVLRDGYNSVEKLNQQSHKFYQNLIADFAFFSLVLSTCYGSYLKRAHQAPSTHFNAFLLLLFPPFLFENPFSIAYRIYICKLWPLGQCLPTTFCK